MKKEYKKPVVEKIEFCYRDQVVAASGGQSDSCTSIVNYRRPGECTVTSQVGAWMVPS